MPGVGLGVVGGETFAISGGVAGECAAIAKVITPITIAAADQNRTRFNPLKFARVRW